jgi:hypothetical protein
MYGVVKFDLQNYTWANLTHTILNIYNQQNEPQDGDQSQINPDFTFALNKELAPSPRKADNHLKDCTVS